MLSETLEEKVASYLFSILFTPIMLFGKYFVNKIPLEPFFSIFIIKVYVKYLIYYGREWGKHH